MKQVRNSKRPAGRPAGSKTRHPGIKAFALAHAVLQKAAAVSEKPPYLNDDNGDTLPRTSRSCPRISQAVIQSVLIWEI